MDQRLINANDPVLKRLSVIKEDGYRYVPWEAISQVPTAEAYLRRGSWRKYRSSGETIRVGFFCNACDFWSKQMTNYCPNCGARMNEGE